MHPGQVTRAHAHTQNSVSHSHQGQLNISNQFLDCGMDLEYLEKTHDDNSHLLILLHDDIICISSGFRKRIFNFNIYIYYLEYNIYIYLDI